MVFLNLTKTEVVLWKNGQRKNEVVFPPSGTIARVIHEEEGVGFPMQGVEAKVVSFKGVEGLPEDSRPELRYFVTEGVWGAVGFRKDLVCGWGQVSGEEARRRSAKRMMRVHPVDQVDRFFEGLGWVRCGSCREWGQRIAMATVSAGDRLSLVCGNCRKGETEKVEVGV